MIGLAVGIDYALFILARYRSELRAHRRPRGGRRRRRRHRRLGGRLRRAHRAHRARRARRRRHPVPDRHGPRRRGDGADRRARGADAAARDPRAARSRRPSAAPCAATARPATRRAAWSTTASAGRALVGRARWPRSLLVVVALGALAIPVKDLYLAFPTDSTAATDTTQRAGLRPHRRRRSAPAARPRCSLVVDARDVPAGERQQAFGEVVAWAEAQDGVANAQVAGTNADPRPSRARRPRAERRRSSSPPSSGPTTPRAEELLAELRGTQDAIEAETGTTIGVTGLTAIQHRRLRAARRRAAGLPRGRHRAGLRAADGRLPLACSCR